MSQQSMQLTYLLKFVAKYLIGGQLETVETETGDGKWKTEPVKKQMYIRLKSLINDHLLKTTSLQRPHSN